jgi:hypothetical protein
VWHQFTAQIVSEPDALHQVGSTAALRPLERNPSATHAAIAHSQVLVRDVEVHLLPRERIYFTLLHRLDELIARDKAQIFWFCRSMIAITDNIRSSLHTVTALLLLYGTRCTANPSDRPSHLA